MEIYERKQIEKEQKRKKIINAARKVFSTKKFSAATMQEIASEAHLTCGTLYLYFKSKEDLHVLISIELLKHLADKTHLVAGKNISVETKIEKICEIFIEVCNSDLNHLINLFHLQSGEILKNLSTEVLQQLKENAAATHGAITHVMKEGIEQKIFIDEHPAALADILWATYAGTVLRVDSKRILNGQKDFVEHALNTAFKIISTGLKLSEPVNNSV